VKRAVRERDGMKCVRCGMTNDQHRRKSRRQLEVHRITPGSRYTVAGCMTLCLECHRGEPKQTVGAASLPDGISSFSELCSVAEAAAELGLSKSRINQFIADGRLEVVVAVGVRAVRRVDVAAIRPSVRGKAGRPPKTAPPKKPRKGKEKP
jgi:hypothetical protein